MFVDLLLPLFCVLSTGPSLCAEGLLQDPRQHCAPSWDCGATFYRFLWMPRSATAQKHTLQLSLPISEHLIMSSPVFVFSSLRSVFRRAPRVHAGPDDWCNQELLPEVPASQPDLSPAPKPSAGSTTFPASSRSGSLVRLKWTLRSHLLSFCSQWPWVSQPKEKHLLLLRALMWS